MGLQEYDGGGKRRCGAENMRVRQTDRSWNWNGIDAQESYFLFIYFRVYMPRAYVIHAVPTPQQLLVRRYALLVRQYQYYCYSHHQESVQEGGFSAKPCLNATTSTAATTHARKGNVPMDVLNHERGRIPRLGRCKKWVA